MNHMENNKKNWPVIIGSLATALYLFTNEANILPDFLEGFIIGIGIAGNLIGILRMRGKNSKFCEWKKSLFLKVAHK